MPAFCYPSTSHTHAYYLTILPSTTTSVNVHLTSIA